MKHQLLICQLLPSLFSHHSIPFLKSFPVLVSTCENMHCLVRFSDHSVRLFVGIASQDEWRPELIHLRLHFSCNHLSFFDSESERNAVSSNKAIHLCWKISFKSGWKQECKRQVLGEPILLKDCLKCSHKWLGTLLCRTVLCFNSDGFSQAQWKVLCWGHIFKLGKSSQHNWSQRNRELAKSEHFVS